MILIKFLGLLDLVSGVLIILLKFSLFQQIGLILSFILALKAVVFIKDIASLIDLVTAVFFFLASIDYYFSFTWIFSIWLIQKGLFSFIYN